MRQILVALVLLVGTTALSFGQSFRGIDKSPMDIAYLPDNFAHDRKPGDEAIIRVIYSRPHVKGREIFGGLVPYGKVWRTGANEATEIKVYRDIEIGGKPLKAGTYSLFTVPDEKEWTIIFNSDLDYWGAYSYNEDHDVLRITARAQKKEEPVEAFSIRFDDHAMRMAWDRTLVEVPISY